MTDEQLKEMTKNEANKTLSRKDKIRWTVLKNSTANLYCIIHGNIEEVSAEGWWLLTNNKTMEQEVTLT